MDCKAFSLSFLSRVSVSSSSALSECPGDLSFSLCFLCFERLCLCFDPLCFLCFLCFFFFSALSSFSSGFSCSSAELSSLAGAGDLLGDFLGTSSSGTEGLRRTFLGGGSGDLSSLEDLLAGAFRLARSRGGDSEGLRLAERACGRVSGEADGLGDCLEARDLGLTSGSGEDECERLEPCNLGALAGGGEADAERLVLRTGEADAACADFRLLGLSGDTEGDFRTTRLRSRLSTRGEADRDRLFRSPFDLVASLGGDLTGDSRVSLGFFFADAGGSGEAEDDDDRLASRVFDFFAESASA